MSQKGALWALQRWYRNGLILFAQRHPSFCASNETVQNPRKRRFAFALSKCRRFERTSYWDSMLRHSLRGLEHVKVCGALFAYTMTCFVYAIPCSDSAFAGEKQQALASVTHIFEKLSKVDCNWKIVYSYFRHKDACG